MAFFRNGAENMEMIPSKSVASLLVNHPEYDAKLIARLAAYNEGGDAFPIASELRFRPLELSGDPQAAPMRSARVGAAFYTNYFGDTIADLVATVCGNPIEIEDTQDREYWSALSVNADGRKGSANGEVRGALTDDFLFGRAFYLVKFQKPKASGSDLAKGTEVGDYDGQVVWLDTQTVTSWALDTDGSLLWARIYQMELIGEEFESELHSWTFYNADSVRVYEATKEVGKDWPKDAKATLNAEESALHALGVCPVFKVNRKMRGSVGAKLLPTARQLFNEESDESYNQFMSKTNCPIIYTDKPAAWQAGIVFSPQGMIIAGERDKIEFTKIDAAAAASFAAASAARRGQLGGLIHNMARQSAAQSASGQNTSRNSAQAIEKHQNPMNAWLRGYAEPHVACWMQMATAIAALRQDDISDVEICGLMPADEDDAPDMEAAAAFLALPYVPDAHKKEYARAIGYAACESVGVDAETLEKIADAPAADAVIPPAPIVAGGLGTDAPVSGGALAPMVKKMEKVA